MWGRNQRNATLLLFCCGFLCAFVMTATALPTTIRVCAMYSSTVSDLGYSFTHNLGRLEAIRQFQQAYPAVELEFPFYENVSPTLFLQVLSADSSAACGVFFITSTSVVAGLNLTQIALDHPQQWFVAVNGTYATVSPASFPPNLLYYMRDMLQQYHLAGVAAALQSDNCVSLITSFASGTMVQVINGIWHGMQLVNKSTPLQLHVMPIGTFNNATLERQAASVLVDTLQCDVIATYVNTRETVLLVSELPNAATREAHGIMSIGGNADNALYVGDSVLMSVYFDITKYFFNLTQGYLLSSIDTMISSKRLLGLSSGVSIVSEVSRYGKKGIAERIAAEVQVCMSSQRCSYCGNIYDSNGTLRVSQPATTCLSEPQALKIDFPERGITVHPTFPDVSLCRAGTAVTFRINNSTGVLQLDCVPCSNNSVSRTSGSWACTPCLHGEQASADRTECFRVVVASFPAWAIVLIVCCASVSLIGVVGATVYYLKVAVSGQDPRSPKYAPVGPVVAIGIIAIDDKSTDWRRGGITMMAEVYDTLTNIVSAIASHHRLYVFAVVGDLHFMASADPLSLMIALCEIELKVSETRWPACIAIRAAMHVGTPRVVVKKRPTPRVEYSGPDLEATKDIFRVSEGGQFVCSSTKFFTPPAAASRLERSMQLPREPVSIVIVQIICAVGALITRVAPTPTPISFARNPLSLPSETNEKNVEESEDSSQNLMSDESANSMGSALSQVEYDCAKAFSRDSIAAFVQLLPEEKQVDTVSSVCRRLNLPLPMWKRQPATGQRKPMLHRSLIHIAAQVVQSLDHRELASLTDSWAEAREKRLAGTTSRACALGL